MNLLTKLRPGTFGLLIAALMLSTVGTSMLKGTRSASRNTPANINTASLEAPAEADSESEATVGAESELEASEASEAEPELTYYQYQIDVEIANLDKLIRKEARDRIDDGITAEQVKGALASMAQETPTAASAARKLYL